MRNSPYRDWRDYQEAVATFFRERGCSAIVDEPHQGARGVHKIDVYVTFRLHGVECHWVIECKLWKGRVKKQDVLALRGVVEDVGADRGIIFCENGFQSGAQNVASHTNILLVTSLEDFKRTVSIEDKRSWLIKRESDQPGAPPVYAFPNHDQPQHLLLYGGRVFAANWRTGNIAVVDPESKLIEGIIDLDKYEVRANSGDKREIGQYPPGEMACADGKLFVGQVFSEFVLAIDIATQSIVKRIAIPGGGEGSIAASRDGRKVFFASNRVNRLFIIDSATYKFEEVDYPEGGRGCGCLLPHPLKSLLYIGIQRGGTLDGISYPHGNCFLATYDLAQRQYVDNLYLAEIENGRSDDSIPACLTFDEEVGCLFVGMFQSMRGICCVDEYGHEILANYRFAPNAHNRHFRWVNPISQALHRGKLLSVNRQNCELVTLDKWSGHIENATFLGDELNGPAGIVVAGDVAVVSYPEREGLIFHSLHL